MLLFETKNTLSNIFNNYQIFLDVNLVFTAIHIYSFSPSQERDSYKNILDSYESEMTQTLDSTAQKKFKILEESCDGFKKHCLEKDGEIQKLSELIQNLKRKIVAVSIFDKIGQCIVSFRNKDYSYISC